MFGRAPCWQYRGEGRLPQTWWALLISVPGRDPKEVSSAWPSPIELKQYNMRCLINTRNSVGRKFQRGSVELCLGSRLR